MNVFLRAVWNLVVPMISVKCRNPTNPSVREPAVMSVSE
jgi:hypothetical protein